MKKTNLMTLLSFVLLIVMAILVMILWKTPSENTDADTRVPASQQTTFVSDTQTDVPDTSKKEKPKESTRNSADETKPEERETAAVKQASVSMKDALFIGDSRTVGLSEYGEINGADFFADVGMNVFNIHKKTVSVPTAGKVTLTQLLTNKKYGKIYIMLGINEIGYPFDNIISKYNELIDLVHGKQPSADIFIQANLHVTKERSDKDKVINNDAINKLNKKLSTFADGKYVFYLDCNPIFDDANGSLSADKTGDGAHPYGKYYMEWGQWLVKQTALIEEG